MLIFLSGDKIVSQGMTVNDVIQYVLLLNTLKYLDKALLVAFAEALKHLL